MLRCLHPKNQLSTAIATLQCPDKKGIVAEITNYIAKHGGNIINLDQYTDALSAQFFMRLEWDLSKFNRPRKAIEKDLKNFKGLSVYFSDHYPRMAIFVSKFDHCLYDLLLRHRSGEIQCDIPLIISNHKDLHYVAKAFGAEFHYIPVNEDNKAEAEKKQAALCKKYTIDLIVLARYMQVISTEFISQFPQQIINVHHSFLPAFTGAKPYHQAFAKGVKIIGATSHFVNEELDQGPIIQQTVTQISHRDNVDDLVVKGRDLERKVLADAVRLFIEHRLFVCNNRTIIL